MDQINNLENVNNQKKITPMELPTDDKKILLFNVINLFSESTINTQNLGKYRHENMSLENVVSIIIESGLEEAAIEFWPKVIRVRTLNPLTDLMEFNRFLRVFLKEAEEMIEERAKKESKDKELKDKESKNHETT